jgi:hypothetical protein
MTFCTVITKPYLAHARTLHQSIRAIHPDAEFYALLADRADGYFNPAAEPFPIVPLEAIGYGDVVHRMSTYYAPVEFCCALKPLLLEWVWKNTSAAQWFYMDADTFVVGDMSDAFAALSGASVLVNPQLIRSAPPALFRGTEFSGLECGLYNGGFVGVRRTQQANDFIKWWRSRLVRYCFKDVPGLFLDQLWLNHVPLFFPETVIYKHPGANLAHWNLHERDGRDLMFVHFSGWDIAKPEQVSRFAPAYANGEYPQPPVWREVGLKYRDALLSNGYATCIRWPYAFDRDEQGKQLTLEARRAYYKNLYETP